jgi:membrane-bound lytic murein transglycosylase A
MSNGSRRLSARTPGRFALAVLAAWLLLGCPAPPKPPAEPPAEAVPALTRIDPSAYPDFDDDLDPAGLEQAIALSIGYLQTLPPSREFEFGLDRYTAAQVLLSLQHFQEFIRTRPSASDLKGHIQAFYRVYQSVGRTPQREVLFTGYFEPLLKGRRSKGPDHRQPIYARPDDLLTIELRAFSDKYAGDRLVGRVQDNRVVPYHDRRDIEAGALNGRARALAWVSDPVDVFFLHVQGSGKVLLEDGQVLNIGYDTGNGRPYRSIGQLLIEEGRISREDMSMQRIRAYLKANPNEVQRVLNHNPSYIFFKITPDGPLGFINVKLTPGRSIALDRALFPPAALAFVQTRKPVIDGQGRITSWVECKRFALNQDTGGAIKGPGRADLFWGSGPEAEIAAGHLKHPGSLYFLMRRPDAAP